jgi:RNA polymerase sigma-70 factor, ECF subfamily
LLTQLRFVCCRTGFAPRRVVRIVTRQSLNRLRTLRRQRVSYVATWLPEPVVSTPDVAEDVELADSVSFAMLVVLETLTPLERAVFLLRGVFGFDYDEIARATDKTPAAVRQVPRAPTSTSRPGDRAWIGPTTTRRSPPGSSPP